VAEIIVASGAEAPFETYGFYGGTKVPPFQPSASTVFSRDAFSRALTPCALESVHLAKLGRSKQRPYPRLAEVLRRMWNRFHLRAGCGRGYRINLVDTGAYVRIIIGLVWRHPSHRRLIGRSRVMAPQAHPGGS
jgi:hypothetical protein